MLVASMILGMLGGLLGIGIEFHILDGLGLQAPAPPTNTEDFVILFGCAAACIIGGAIVPSRRALNGMFLTEIGAMLLLVGGTSMGIYLGLASKTSIPIYLTFAAAMLALVAVDKYPRAAEAPAH